VLERGSLDRRAQLVGDERRRVERSLRKQQDELLAAEPREEIRGPLGAAEQLRHGAQQPVTRLVTEPVVDELETIDIEDRVAERLAVPLPAQILLVEPLLVRVTAVRARQRIDQQPALLRCAERGELGRAGP